MKLEITNDRGFHTIDIAMEKGELKQFKIPVELRVYEIERLLEAQHKLEKLEKESVIEDGTKQLRIYWGYIYAQLEVIFKHFHPEIEAEYLKLNLLPADAIKILAFFAQNRYIEKEVNLSDDTKKKLN